MPLFCGEDLNFGAFSKYFPLGKWFEGMFYFAIVILDDEPIRRCSSHKNFLLTICIL
jgi:hypothetical protein